MDNTDQTVAGLNIMHGRHIVHLNTRSIREKKIDELLVRFTGTNFEFVTISESWLKDSDADITYDIPGYYLYRNDRKWSDNPLNTDPKVGGGIITYVNDKIKSSEDELLQYNKSNVNIEIQCITSIDEFKQKSVVCTVYRPPQGDMDIFIDTLEEIVGDIVKHNSTRYYFIGDFNIDLLDVNLKDYSEKLITMMLQNGLMNYIKEPTRHGDKESCLDLLFTNVNDISES